MCIIVQILIPSKHSRLHRLTLWKLLEINMIALIMACALIGYSSTLQHSVSDLNIAVTGQQIAQYNDSVLGCSGLRCFTYNFTSNTIYSEAIPSTPANAGCNFTDFVMVEKKFHKMWHFQICNMSSNTTTSAYNLLRFRNLVSGIKFEAYSSTFGSFGNDQDRPWYYSQATKQMIMPWYFLRGFQRIVFNVNTEKMMLHGEMPQVGFQKSKNASSRTLYRLEGYPDDNSTHSILSDSLPENISKACLAANSRYVVMVVSTQPSLQIFNTKLKQMIFEEILTGWETGPIRLTKVNETHVVIAKGGLLPQFRVYDLRIPGCIASIQLPESLCSHAVPSTIITPFLHQMTLVYHSSAEPSKLFILTCFEIKKMQKVVYDGPDESPLCPQPKQIIDSKYCVLCNFGCLECEPESENICRTCTLGFVLASDGQCVPSWGLVALMDFYSALAVINVFNFHTQFYDSMDNLWMYNHHSTRFHAYAKSFLLVVYKVNSHKHVPYSVSSALPRSQPRTGRSSMLPPQYLNHLRSAPADNSIVLAGVLFSGILLTASCFALTRGLQKLATLWQLPIGSLLSKSTMGLILVANLIATRAGYVGWVFWSQIYVPSWKNTHQKITMVGLIIAFFIILFHSFCFYSLVKWHHKEMKKISIFMLHYQRINQSLVFLTMKGGLFLLDTFLHVYCSQSPVLQKGLLFGSAFGRLALIIVQYRIFEIVLHYFTSLFYQVSMFLFAGVLLLDSLECPELFQVQIKLVEFVGLLMLGLLAFLQTVSCLGVTVRRILIQAILQLDHIQQQKEAIETPDQMAQHQKLILKAKSQKCGSLFLQDKQATSKSIEQQVKQNNTPVQIHIERTIQVEEAKTSQFSLLHDLLSFIKSSKLVSTNHTLAMGRSNKVSPKNDND